MESNPSSLLIVAGHAIWHANDWHGIEASRFPDPEAMKCTIAQHVQDGCTLVRDGLYDAIAFSGGQSRKDLYKDGILTSEAEGMNAFAQENGWLPKNVILETRARDSFENVFFSLLHFHQESGEWPANLGLLSMPHKSIRFMLMATGLKISAFTFHGVGKVDPLEKNCVNEMKNMTLVIHTEAEHVADPLLRATYFAKKRLGRTPPDYDTTGSAEDLRQRDNKYLNKSGNAYDNKVLTDKVTACDSHGGWAGCEWPWST